MKRKIIKINEELCNGCGLCANACQEGAIGMVNGKARLLRDDYCDGLGNCLPVCPTGAIRFEEREALEFDESAVEKHMNEKKSAAETAPKASSACAGGSAHTGGCPGSRAAALRDTSAPAKPAPAVASSANNNFDPFGASELMQWPVQLKLLPVKAPYYEGARLLIAADCAAYSNGDFHRRFMKGHITMIGCPKLDEGSYTEKLTAILSENNIRSVTIVRMEVPCCGGLSHAAVEALKNCGKMIPWQVVTLSVKGDVLSE